MAISSIYQRVKNNYALFYFIEISRRRLKLEVEGCKVSVDVNSPSSIKLFVLRTIDAIKFHFLNNYEAYLSGHHFQLSKGRRIIMPCFI